MTADRDLDRRLVGWLDKRATTVVPEGLLERSLARVEATSQRPGWLVRDRQPAPRRPGISRPIALAWAVVLLIALAALAVVATGARLPIVAPPAFLAEASPSDDLLPTPGPTTTPVPPTSSPAPLGGRPIIAHEFNGLSDHGTHDVYAIDAGTGERTLLGTLPGDAITGSVNPYSFQRSGDDRHVLVEGGFGAGFLSLTPAGRAYGFAGDVKVACCDGSLEALTLSPTGDRLAGVHADAFDRAVEIVVTDLNGATVKRFPPHGINGGAHLSWASDESALLFNGCRPCNKAESPLENQTAEHAHLYVVPVDGGEADELLDVDNGFVIGAWSPDGQTLAVGTYICAPGSFAPRCDPADDRDSLSLVRVSDGQQTDLGPVRGLDGLAWSPDGTRIAYGASDGIYVINADGSGKVKVAERPGVPAWSPDGQWLLLDGHDVKTWGLWLVSPDGSGLRRIGVGYAGAAW